jgi:hypothetical protein
MNTLQSQNGTPMGDALARLKSLVKDDGVLIGIHRHLTSDSGIDYDRYSVSVAGKSINRFCSESLAGAMQDAERFLVNRNEERRVESEREEYDKANEPERFQMV